MKWDKVVRCLQEIRNSHAKPPRYHNGIKSRHLEDERSETITSYCDNLVANRTIRLFTTKLSDKKTTGREARSFPLWEATQRRWGSERRARRGGTSQAPDQGTVHTDLPTIPGSFFPAGYTGWYLDIAPPQTQRFPPARPRVAYTGMHKVSPAAARCATSYRGVAYSPCPCIQRTQGGQ